MTAAELVPLAINASLFVVVFALGLNTTNGDALYLSTRPSLMIRSIIAMSVVMVVFAVAIAVMFDLPPAVEIALLALAVSPVPPVLPAKQTQAGGSASYAIALLATAALASIVLAPLAILIVGSAFGIALEIPAGKVAVIVAMSVIAPLVLGIAVRAFAPALAQRLARPLSLAGTVLLVLAFLPVLVMAWPALQALIGQGVIWALVAFTLVGLLVGHVLGGPVEGDRSTLALATGTRHPAVAMAVVTLNFPDERLALAVVLYHLVIGALVAAPYVMWRRKRVAAAPARDAAPT